jgi:hypothetical protein
VGQAANRDFHWKALTSHYFAHRVPGLAGCETDLRRNRAQRFHSSGFHSIWVVESFGVLQISRTDSPFPERILNK